MILKIVRYYIIVFFNHRTMRQNSITLENNDNCMPKTYGSRHRSMKWITKINKMGYRKMYITIRKIYCP